MQLVIETPLDFSNGYYDTDVIPRVGERVMCEIVPADRPQYSGQYRAELQVTKVVYDYVDKSVYVSVDKPDQG